MATHSSVLAWRIPGTVEPGGLPSMGSQKVGRDWSDLAAAAAAYITSGYHIGPFRYRIFPSLQKILLETAALECISQVPSICTNLCNTALPLAYWKKKKWATSFCSPSLKFISTSIFMWLSLYPFSSSFCSSQENSFFFLFNVFSSQENSYLQDWYLISIKKNKSTLFLTISNLSFFLSLFFLNP